MTHWNLTMVLVLMVFGGRLSSAQDETEEHENVVYDYMVLPPMEDYGSSLNSLPKKIMNLIPAKKASNKNKIDVHASAIKQSPQASFIDQEIVRQEPEPPQNSIPKSDGRERSRVSHYSQERSRQSQKSQEQPRLSDHGQEKIRQSYRNPKPPRPAQWDSPARRRSHSEPKYKLQNNAEVPQRINDKPDRSQHMAYDSNSPRHYDSNSPRHPSDKFKTTHYSYETPQTQYNSVKDTEIVDSDASIIDSPYTIREKTGIPYLDSGSITGSPFISSQSYPYNPEIKTKNYGNKYENPEISENPYRKKYRKPNVSPIFYQYTDQSESALTHVYPEVTITNYANKGKTGKSYEANIYRDSNVRSSSYKARLRTDKPVYVPDLEGTTRRRHRPDSVEASGSRRKIKSHGKKKSYDYVNNTLRPSTRINIHKHYHQSQPVGKRDDYFASNHKNSITTKKRSAHASTTISADVLQCYSCYSSAKSSRACIDPSNQGVELYACKDPREQCYSTFLKTGSYYLSIQRGCMLECHDSIVTECCNATRCNSRRPPSAPVNEKQSARPVKYQRNEAFDDDCAAQHGPPSIMFFLTILLLLHTVVKVAYL